MLQCCPRRRVVLILSFTHLDGKQAMMDRARLNPQYPLDSYFWEKGRRRHAFLSSLVIDVDMEVKHCLLLMLVSDTTTGPFSTKHGDWDSGI